MTVITRFAPSPTGLLHVGNLRTALITWLFTKKHQGKFILRFDDTDLERSQEKYIEAIKEDLSWLGLVWDTSFRQSERLKRYNDVKEQLIKQGRLYPCFETVEELEIKRKLKIASGLPPIYDRASLNLSKEQIDIYLKQSRPCHYRFLLEEGEISWKDKVKGDLRYLTQHLSDPVVIRENGSMTYMLCSVIDDIDFGITDIIRGEDHVSNTALQLQMFKAINDQAILPNFAHLSLIKALADEKISKRVGGFEISSLRSDFMIEPMAINIFFSRIGSCLNMNICDSLENLVNDFDISNFSSSPATYMQEELLNLNHKLIKNLEFEKVKQRLEKLGLSSITEEFWHIIRPNLYKLSDIIDWHNIIYNPKTAEHGLSKSLLQEIEKLALDLLIEDKIDEEKAAFWLKAVQDYVNENSNNYKFKMKDLRLVLTGQNQGPEMRKIIALLGKEEIIARLKKSSA